MTVLQLGILPEALSNKCVFRRPNVDRVAEPKRLEMIHAVTKCKTGLGYSKSQKTSNHMIGSKVTLILLNKWILPIYGIASGKV